MQQTRFKTMNTPPLTTTRTTMTTTTKTTVTVTHILMEYSARSDTPIPVKTDPQQERRR